MNAASAMPCANASVVTVAYSTWCSPADTARTTYIAIASVCAHPVRSSARPVPSRATSQPPSAIPASVPPSENQPVAAIASRENPNAR